MLVCQGVIGHLPFCCLHVFLPCAGSEVCDICILKREQGAVSSPKPGHGLDAVQVHQRGRRQPGPFQNIVHRFVLISVGIGVSKLVKRVRQREDVWATSGLCIETA